MKKTEVLGRLKAWSYSRYSDYAKCPFLCKLKHVMGRREPDNPYSIRGAQAHHDAERYVRGQDKEPSGTLAEFKPEFKELRKQKANVEHEWAFTREWKRTEWFAPDCWLRVKMDVVHIDKDDPKIVHVVDHKTGKIREGQHYQQRELYAIGAFIIYPNVDKVVAKHWYLDSGERRQTTFHRSELKPMIKAWNARVKPMMQDTKFVAVQNNYCKYCHFSAAQGGPCKY